MEAETDARSARDAIKSRLVAEWHTCHCDLGDLYVFFANALSLEPREGEKGSSAIGNLIGLFSAEKAPSAGISRALSTQDKLFKKAAVKAVRHIVPFYVFVRNIHANLSKAADPMELYVAAGGALWFYVTGARRNRWVTRMSGMQEAAAKLEPVLRSVADDICHPYQKVVARVFGDIEFDAKLMDAFDPSDDDRIIRHYYTSAASYASTAFRLAGFSYPRQEQKPVEILRALLEPVGNDPGHPSHHVVVAALRMSNICAMEQAGDLEGALSTCETARVSLIAAKAEQAHT